MSESTPDVATQPGDELLLELADDYLHRYRAGEEPSVDEYVSMHPEFADRIRELFPAMIAMEQPAPGATVDLAPPTERVGAIIGRYKLLERIGEGGFGVVYMAEQQQPVRRKVALKVMKPGIDTRQVIARFEAERQALALMEHENIAKVLDAGATDSGRPYFVMELVRGVPITEFCDKNALTARERLELFVEVCRAVQHAHTKGIIHRDIKPTNVLVTLQAGAPVPKIIDFGVAKATGQQLTEKTLFTNFAQMVGTPLYMSPEQAEMTSIDVDTRSDVYSLGVLLYELLTGTTPLDKERLKAAAFDEVRRIIREDEPPRPSVRLSTMGQQAGRSISAHRISDAQQLLRLVRGELDWIVMKAMEKDRARRYETASALAADVQRYLRDEPVEACPPSAWYRFRKFARRRKALLGVVSGVALLVLAAVGMLLMSNVQVSKALGRERRGAYFQRIALAEREWGTNNLSRMEQLLNDCPSDLRGWEWHYLKRLRYSTHPPLRHESAVFDVAFSPDGNLLATSTQAGNVRIWQAKTGQVVQTWPAHQMSATTIRFSPDGRFLATGSVDKTVNVWDVERVRRGELEEPHFRWEHASRVRSVSFSPDGRYLASAGGKEAEKTGEVNVWDMNTGQKVFPTMRFTWAVRSVQFSPDGRRLATASGELVQVWDAHTGQEQFPSCRDPDGLLETVVFSPDGRRLAAVGGHLDVSPNSEVKVWDAQTGKEILRLRGHVGELRGVAFSPDGRLLASAGLDQTVKLWDAQTGEEVFTLRGHRDNVLSVTFSPDSCKLASASVDNSVRLWDATPMDREPTPEYRTLRGHAGAVFDVEFHPSDGRTLLSAGADGTVREWDFQAGTELVHRQRTTGSRRPQLAGSPDGRRLAVSEGIVAPVRVWDTTTATESRLFRAHTASVACLAFSPDSRHIASGDSDSVVRVWDATTLQESRPVMYQNSPAAVAFSPDGRHLVVGSSDSTVYVWDWKSGDGQPAQQLQHAGRVTSVAFSRDGKRLVSASWDRTIKIWDSATWKLQHDLSDATGAVLCVAFGHDRRLAWGSTDSTVKIWDGPGTEIQVLRGHTSWVQAVAFSPCDKWIASASLDGTVKIWQAPPEEKTQDPEAELAVEQ
ncbi:MAG TPA: protein kinase [Gemmataceae bacterium]|nr:protein kinase [Gemmataceae bacterium]